MKFIKTTEGYVDIHAVNGFIIDYICNDGVVDHYYIIACVGNNANYYLEPEFKTQEQAADYLDKIVNKLNAEAKA